MTLTIFGVEGLGEVTPGTDLVALIADACTLQDGDVVVVSSKVVSKAEGRQVAVLAGEDPDAARMRLARLEEVLADVPGVVIVRTAHGFVCANAGIDASNVPGGGLLLLPEDPDASAAAIRDGLQDRLGLRLGVVISDTFGRAWREGQTDVALGVAGVAALRDERGRMDREGQVMRVTLIAVADQLAAAADLVRSKAAGVPVVVVRGLPAGPDGGTGTGQDLVRGRDGDLFAHGRGWLGRRLAAGDGPATRTGTPSAGEWSLAARAAGGGHRVGAALRVADGLAAGRAEATLLDLGYDARVSRDPWTVTVGPPAV